MRLGRHPLHIHISTLFLILITVFGLLMAGVGYFSLQRMLQKSADDTIQRVSQLAVSEVDKIASPGRLAVAMLGHSKLAQSRTLEERMQFVPLLSEAVERAADLSSVYIGYETGDFFMLRKLTSEDKIRAFNAPPNARYLVQSIHTQGTLQVGRYTYLDNTLEVLKEVDQPEYASDYKVQNQEWFESSITSFGLVTTPPYLFYSTGEIGMSFSQRTQGGEGVIGADISLDTISAGLDPSSITQGTELALSNHRGQLIAFDDVSKMITSVADGKGGSKIQLATLDNIGVPAFVPLHRMVLENPALTNVSMSHDVAGEEWLISINRIVFQDAQPLYLSIATPTGELFADAIGLRNQSLLLTLFLILCAVPLTLALARVISRSMRDLMQDVESIQRFDFSETPSPNSTILEVNELAATLENMKSTIHRFMDISRAVAAEERFEVLLPMLLRETASAADAPHGILYLADEDRLIPGATLSNGVIEETPEYPEVLVGDIGGELRLALEQHEPFHMVISQQPQWLPKNWIQPGQSIIIQQLLNRRKERVGVLVLARTDEIDAAQLAFVSTLASTASGSLETRELIAAQKNLFEAFIKMIASAIDAKSPYTGGHCERVPELTKMLARAACDATSGTYTDFKLSEADWEAVHVASWLHDCGKVTTPEYVVDKATKLETIYDRIHEVRMRFEVMKLEAKVQYLQHSLEGRDPEKTKAELDSELASLDDDFYFIASCNEGGEFMAPEKVERLTRIGGRVWTRTLSDRVGISQEEHLRKEATVEAPLPASEFALADRPEHVLPRKARDAMPEENPWGFKMPVPEALYNRGELHNLSIGRGTLTDEDRYKINEHIVQTIIMLSTLPFPKHLKQVPEIAGGHHEKMDGTGYPKRLSREDMSPVARMMAIADIFEALTAIDRPYKKGKVLSEALKIMSFMCKDQHIDPELFELFLRSGAYSEYAKQFMKPEQVDQVDIEDYMPKFEQAEGAN